MCRDDILAILSEKKDLFSKKYGVKRIGVFGSYAREEASEKSDIDIFAEMPPKFTLLTGLQEELESFLGRKIDLVRLRERMNPRLRENIMREGIDA